MKMAEIKNVNTTSYVYNDNKIIGDVSFDLALEGFQVSIRASKGKKTEISMNINHRWGTATDTCAIESLMKQARKFALMKFDRIVKHLLVTA